MLVRKICRLLFFLIIALTFSQIVRWWHVNDVSYAAVLAQFTPGDYWELLKSAFTASFDLCPFIVYAFIALTSIRAIL